MLLWLKQGCGLTHVSNDKYCSFSKLSMQHEICKKLHCDVNVVVLKQTLIRQPSDSSPVWWDEQCIMYAAQFNVPRVPAIARTRCIFLCLPTMQFLHLPSEWFRIEKCSEIIDDRMTVLLTQSHFSSREANIHKQAFKPRYRPRSLYSKQFL